MSFFHSLFVFFIFRIFLISIYLIDTMDIAFDAISSGYAQIIKSESLATYDTPSKGPDFN